MESIKKPLYVGCPNLAGRGKLKAAIDTIFKTRRLTNDGPYVKEFEKQICQFLNVPHAIAVCNGTVGLQILAKALEFEQGHKKVVVPAFTFPATVYAMNWIGAQITFADINRRSHNIDYPGRIDPRFSYLPTHLWGRPCHTWASQKIANVSIRPAVIFDAAHAFGCSLNGVKIGSFGLGEVFSFHATKVVNSFEGGVITTRFDSIADTCRLLRNFGFEGYDLSTEIGTNGKMSEIHATMGLCSLENYHRYVAHNLYNYQIYRDNLEFVVYRFLRHKFENTPNYQYVVIELNPEVRDTVMQALWAEKIYARRYFYPGVHRMALYEPLNISMPNTSFVAERVLVLPNGTTVNGKDVQRVCRIIRKEIEKWRKAKASKTNPKKAKAKEASANG